MKTSGKIFIGFISTFLFIALIFLATIRFELLDRSFLLGAFEKSNVYAQLPPLLADYISNNADFSEQERIVYSDFAKNISPQNIKPIIENNLTQVLNFLNGQSKDVAISFSLKGVGFQDSSGFNWSPSQIPDQNLREKVRALNGISDSFIAAGFTVLTILIGLFFLYGILSTPIQLLEGRALLLSGGIFIIATGLVSKIFLVALGKELIASQELSQKILGLLLTSLSPGITTTWLITGGVLILLWLILHIKSPIHTSEV